MFPPLPAYPLDRCKASARFPSGEAEVRSLSIPVRHVARFPAQEREQETQLVWESPTLELPPMFPCRPPSCFPALRSGKFRYIDLRESRSAETSGKEAAS